MASTSDSGSAKVKLAFQEVFPFTEFLLMQLLPLPSAAIGDGGRGEPYRYFIHPLIIGMMGAALEAAIEAGDRTDRHQQKFGARSQDGARPDRLTQARLLEAFPPHLERPKSRSNPSRHPTPFRRRSCRWIVQVRAGSRCPTTLRPARPRPAVARRLDDPERTGAGRPVRCCRKMRHGVVFVFFVFFGLFRSATCSRRWRLTRGHGQPHFIRFLVGLLNWQIHTASLPDSNQHF